MNTITVKIMSEFLRSPMWIYEDGIVTDDLPIVKCFYTGKKILVDMESLYDLINGEKTVNSPTQKNEM